MRRQILVIDDDSSVREMIAAVLRRERFDVVGTPHGGPALEFVDGDAIESYAAIILQVNVRPSRIDATESTGIALLNHMRLTKPHLMCRTVVATTRAQLAKDLGCSVIVQPFDVAELIAAVRRCVTLSDSPEG